MVKLGIIGGGVMGEALLSRLLARQVYLPVDVLVSDPVPERRSLLAQTYGVAVTADNREGAGATEVILLAIKPQLFESVTADLVTAIDKSVSPVLISILAGTPIARLEAAFPGLAVVRAMPNTPATIGAGMTAIAAGSYTQPDDVATAIQVFSAVGEVVEVPESLMDAVTGLSGSGPGFVAVMIEALTDGGVVAGLPRAIARQLALQTVKGTAQLLQETGLHPGELKDRVTSPGGTTIAGVAQLELAAVRSAFIEAVRAACARSRELGQ